MKPSTRLHEDTLRAIVNRMTHGPGDEVKVMMAREILDLHEALEPGKANKIVMGMFDLAHEYGHPLVSSTHALTFLRKEMERLAVYKKKEEDAPSPF